MNQQMTRTLIFVGVAAVCVAGAIGTSAVNRPVKLDDTVQVGEKFYPDFTDPTKATSLRVAAYDKDSAQVKLFNVEFKNNLWRIPSHHDYPADGEEQLAKTAASVIGIERGAYSGKTPDDHKRLGVLDPLDDKITGSEGRGDRVTLTEGDKVVVDFIIGKPVPDMENTYYVRRADEPRVFRARLDNFKVSTKFADWIEQDLLKVQSNKVVDLVIDRYHVDAERGAIVQEEVNHLLKDDKSAWTLEGLNTETEKVKTSTVSSMTYALQDLKIVGVRPKPAGLSAQLRREEGAALNQLDVIEMQQRGFYLTGNGELVSNEGEFLAGTNEGVKYTLRFGKVFTGSDVEIEAGKPKEETGKSTDESGEQKDSAAGDGGQPATDAADPNSDAESTDPDGDDTSLKKNRYVFITASFDERLLGPRPEAPVKPEPPPEAATPAADAPAAGEGTPAEKPADGATPEAPPAGAAAGATESDDGAADDAGKPDGTAAQAETTDTTPPADGEEQPKPEGAQDAKPDAAADQIPAETKPDPKMEYEAALKKYDADQKEFERKNKEYDDKIAAGKKLADELNVRFASWYYVIDAAQFDKLHVKRTDLVEPKEPTTPGAGTPAPGAAATTPPEPPTAEAGTKPEAGAGTKPADNPPPGDSDPPKAGGDAAAPAPGGDKTGDAESSAGTKPAEPAAGTPPGDDANPSPAKDSPANPAP